MKKYIEYAFEILVIALVFSNILRMFWEVLIAVSY